MNKTLCACFGAVAVGLSALADDPHAEDVTVSRGAFARRYQVSYILKNGPAIVTADVQTNAGNGVWASVGGEHLRTLLGDVNRVVSASDGTRTFTWDPAAEWPDRLLAEGQIRISVNVWKKSAPPDYMVVDLCTSNCVSFYERAEAIPDGVTADVNKTDRLVMRKIPAASVRWQMGADKFPGYPNDAGWPTKHHVTLTEDFYIGVYELTQGQCANIYARSGCASYQTLSLSKPLYPVQAYFGNFRSLDVSGTTEGYVWPTNKHTVHPNSPFAKLGTFSGLGLAFDYPTESQWEYACRAGSPDRFYSGESDAHSIGWTSDHPKVTEKPMPVGQLEPNAWGLYDMIGNAPEWCLDWWHQYGAAFSPEMIDPVGPDYSASQSNHLLRGGAAEWPMAYAGAEVRYRSTSSAGTRLYCPAAIP